MRNIVIGIVLAALALSSCNSNGKKAQQRLDMAKAMYERAEYAAAKMQIDSIRILYPKEVSALKGGLILMRQVEQTESERNIAFCDSMMPIKIAKLPELEKNFVYEIDSAYNNIGKFVPKIHTVERNILRSYVRAGVYASGEMYLASVYFGKNAINHTGMKLSVGDTFVETPSIPYDGGLNFHFTDLGNVTEVVTYMGEKCEAAADFIYNNQNARIRVAYTGGKPCILYLGDGDKQAIVDTYKLAVTLSDIDRMKTEKIRSMKKLAYLKHKLGEE